MAPWTFAGDLLIDIPIPGRISWRDAGIAERALSPYTSWALIDIGCVEAATEGPSVVSAGGSQSLKNVPPHLTSNYCIALEGIFPSRKRVGSTVSPRGATVTRDTFAG